MSPQLLRVCRGPRQIVRFAELLNRPEKNEEGTEGKKEEELLRGESCLTHAATSSAAVQTSPLQKPVFFAASQASFCSASLHAEHGRNSSCRLVQVARPVRVAR